MRISYTNNIIIDNQPKAGLKDMIGSGLFTIVNY